MNLQPPDAAEAELLADGIVSAVAGPSGLQPVQRALVEALFPAMTGHRISATGRQPTSPAAFAEALARRDLAFRSRIVQLMVLCALVTRPLCDEVAVRVASFARELGVEDGMVGIAQKFAAGSLGLAAVDFRRNGYEGSWDDEASSAAVHSSRVLGDAWEVSVADRALAARWAALEELPPDALGRKVWELYEARGFTFPGTPGSAPPLLAQHDWVHVLADYGTTVESEVEVFGLIARANDDMRAFSLLAMVISLFETGYLTTGAGLFESSPGHFSSSPAMAVRLSDALRRGALCRDAETASGSVDFLARDWFALAHLRVEDVRARFGLVPKSTAAVAAGSVGPWERGGISPFQVQAGRDLAVARGHRYRAHGASV